MKSVRILFNGQPLRKVYPHATKWQVAKYKIGRVVRWVVMRVALGAAIGAVVFGAYAYGNAEAANSITVVNQQVAAPKESMAAVMARIAKCESGGKQFLADGSVVTNTNSNGTVDVGLYQINLSAQHLKEMSKLGFNPLTQEGNEAYAKWLYENRGTSDWSSSQHCWQ